ncbi:MAG TPA: energy-coupling factor transporter ATPase [Chloroflexi bacterium]|jgi:energy-coupling factor transport system ATP-binding protein|nr:energy-coupling factor transporter ATPase [Chloroflexota bacterium]
MARGFFVPRGDHVDEPLIRTAHLSYHYDADTDRAIPALHDISLAIPRGEYLAIVGRNGSGKSTLARCLNGLLLPTAGDVWVEGANTRDAAALLGIRATVGMVFQNPDNQIISTVVEEEVAFGPENLGVPREALHQRVDDALQSVGLSALRHRDPHTLSAGQKARLAIAGVLAMRPACLVLDESTAMLDPQARHEVLRLLRDLHAGGLTVVAITHFMDEVVAADRVIVLEATDRGGRIALEGTPRDVLAQAETLEALGLALPPAAAIARGLAARGVDAVAGAITPEELVRAIAAHVRAA